MSYFSQQKIPYLNLDRERGLPSGQVHKIAIDSNNGIWMATPAGLCHYDGQNVATLTQQHGLGTHGLRTTYIVEGEEILVGTDIGLDKRSLNESHFTPVFDPQFWKYGFVECILKNTDGSYWIGTPTGLYHYTPKRDSVKPIVRKHLSGFIQEIQQAANDAIWVMGKPFGLLKLRPEMDDNNQLSNTFNLSGLQTFVIDPNIEDHLLVGGNFGVSSIDLTRNLI
ncbi:MAG: hypothetical protein HKN32_09835, partial [Flavobacteriales bacterium]|nr:hypothetical protein [Flavobacteriales bacterium]